MPSGVIILAEDDTKLRKLYTDALSAAGYDVLAVKNGAEALDLLSTVKPKIIILDVMMPEMTGIEACRRAREILTERIPILFLTSLDRVENVHQCIQAGGDDYLIKSDSLSNLIERVGHWVMRTSPQAHDPRRGKALSDLELVLAEAETNGSDDSVLSSDTDATVREISSLIMRGMKLASPCFGKTKAQKLYLLGYVVGIVEKWAATRSVLKVLFDDYLSAVLLETKILAIDEITTLIGSIGELSEHPIFASAHSRGQFDATEIARRGDNYLSRALADFDERAEAQAADQIPSILRQS